MRKSELRQKAMDLTVEVGYLRGLVNEARDLFERGDFDARDDQRERLRRWMQEARIATYRAPARSLSECTATELIGGTGAGSWFGHAGSCPIHGNTIIEADRALGR